MSTSAESTQCLLLGLFSPPVAVTLFSGDTSILLNVLLDLIILFCCASTILSYLCWMFVRIRDERPLQDLDLEKAPVEPELDQRAERSFKMAQDAWRP